MKELNFGSLDARQLCVRLYAPFVFREWSHGDWRLAHAKLLNPLRWFRAVFSKANWDWWIVNHRDANHRCYCCEGRLFDGRICLAGFSVSWFYSHYTGPVPCPCDEVIAELDDEIVAALSPPSGEAKQ